ncbi:hypothetical protein M3Y99_00743800 [Aphelenchoides fujianensis]|nr:hypothetical protein M3Y99_00743800 [Aphelenchoides fujianensis]
MTTTVKQIDADAVQIEFPVLLNGEGEYGGDLVSIETPKKLLISPRFCLSNHNFIGKLKIRIVDFNDNSFVRLKAMWFLKQASGRVFGQDGYYAETQLTPVADSQNLEYPIVISNHTQYTCQVRLRFLPETAQVPLPKPVECGHLLGSLTKMLDDEKFGDVQFECEGRAFKVSKLFLQAQSDVFDAMFTHDSQEKQTGVIEIKDAKAATVERLVRYLYTGRVEEPKEVAADLLPLAVKYELHELTAMCVNAMDSSLSLANIIERLELVALYDHLDEFKLRVLTFTKQNYEAVRKLPEWKPFAALNGSLICELMELRL